MRSLDISQITDYLYVGAQPDAEHAEQLQAMNIRLIISMCGTLRPPEALTRPPLQVLWLRTFDTIFTPIPMSVLTKGVQAALPVIQEGGRVLAHCRHGRHRGVAMGAAILIALGYSAQEAMQLLCARRAQADPYAWHIRRQIEKFERHWPSLSEIKVKG